MVKRCTTCLFVQNLGFVSQPPHEVVIFYHPGKSLNSMNKLKYLGINSILNTNILIIEFFLGREHRLDRLTKVPLTPKECAK